MKERKPRRFKQQKLSPAQPDKPTTPQQLASLIKSVRDTMRKDKGLSGELDRIPMITWIMFLKFIDDQEKIREAEAKLAGKKFKSTIDSPYRWRDWAADDDGITGTELIGFVNQDEAIRSDKKKGPGLFAYLRSLTGTGARDRRDVVATVFKGIVNRMNNGYLLRDVINKIDSIHFSSTEEIHTLAFLYETLLKEMRDSAGDSGEFYTPRPVIKFMVEAIDPRIGETILDPAAGTGGFLVETYVHLKPQCKKAEDFERLQEVTLSGFEAKPMPYLLCQMNMLLHDIEAPQVDPGNALRFPLGEIGDKDRIDIVLTNPPFGGAEEKGILSNFPEDKQTSETALLFLQLIMRKLRRQPRPGRAAVVVPNGILSGDGVCARIKEQLLKEFNLHTIVRLPYGVFAPYTPIPTNILFFDRSGQTKEVWYYEQPLPEGRKSYTKTMPIHFDEFKPCLDWWKNRQSSERAWRISVEDIANYNLDIKNPSNTGRFEHLAPDRLVEEMMTRERNIVEGLSQVNETLSASWVRSSDWTPTRLSAILQPVSRLEGVDPLKEYRLLGVRLEGGGPFIRETKLGSQISATSLSKVQQGDFIYSRLFAWRGAFGVIGSEENGCYVSNEFPTFVPIDNRVDVRFLQAWFRLPSTLAMVEAKCTGTTPLTRNRFKENFFLALEVPLPPLGDQQRIVDQFQGKLVALRHLQAETSRDLDALLLSVLDRAFKRRT